MDLIGKTVSHYKILEKLGEGGMGVVYKAEDTKLGRHVALKFLPSNLTKDPDAKKRFIQEAKAASALQHHHVATIHEIDETEDGQLFICMDYYAGESLNVRITKRPIKVDEAVDVALQIAQGLDKAHQKGIVHRDIKPGNIVLTEDSVVKIVDFGLAKLSGQSRLTKEASTLGTAAYMSPEQARGEDADHQSDIWSVGVVLYEMLSGLRPFQGEYEQAVLYAIINSDPEPLTALRTGIPLELEKIVFKCIEKDRSLRYQHADELIADLKRLEKQAIEETVGVKPSDGKKKTLANSPGFLTLICVIMIIIAGLFIIKQKRQGGGQQFGSFTQIEWNNSIVVLPFVDMSPEQDQEFFCDGMSEEIINTLTNIEKLRVIARTSAFAFKDQNIDVREIGKKLGVETLLEGSIRKSGERIRVTAQLIRASDGTHLWSKQYDRNLTDIFSIQDEIALAIVDQLKIKLVGSVEQRMSRRFTQNLEAHNEYLRGRHLLNKRRKEDVLNAVSHFERAIELDSTYVMGYVGLADAYSLMVPYASVPAQSAYPKAKTMILKALEIDDQVGEAYASLGWIKMQADWDWEGAEDAFERALMLNPGYATAYHWYGYYFMYRGVFDRAVPMARRAWELDPLSPVINRVVGDVYYYARQYDEAIAALNRTVELEPCVPYCHNLLGTVYIQKEMYEEAIVELSKENDCVGHSRVTEPYFGIVYARTGQMEKANQIYERIQARVNVGLGDAILYFELDHIDNGFELLEDLGRKRSSWLNFIGINPGFDKVRSEPRFQALMKQVGLEL